MKKEYFKPKMETVKLTSENIANTAVTLSSKQTTINTLSFKSNTVKY
ncbi:MAG: hypothetical protein LUG66_09830 [Clostridiales bacterium]|nr:hypothetical protein [Clostridiales bacterium]